MTDSNLVRDGWRDGDIDHGGGGAMLVEGRASHSRTHGHDTTVRRGAWGVTSFEFLSRARTFSFC